MGEPQGTSEISRHHHNIRGLDVGPLGNKGKHLTLKGTHKQGKQLAYRLQEKPNGGTENNSIGTNNKSSWITSETFSN